jgi:hypothetical protein
MESGIAVSMRSDSPHPISHSIESAIATFCSQLATPLEEVSNLLYLATHERVEPGHSQHCLGLANQKLQQVRQLVLEHCETNVLLKKAS